MNPYEQAISARRLDLGTNPGTMTNMASEDIVNTSFKVGTEFVKAVDLDGVDDHVNCGNDTSLQITNNLSFVVWVECGAQDVGNWLGSKYGGDPERGWLLRTYGAVGPGAEKQLQFLISDDGSSDPAHFKNWFTTNQVLPASGWAQIAFTFASGTPKLYVNATEITIFTKAVDGAITSINNAVADFILAIDSNLGWKGEMCNASIWDTAVLAQADITALYNSGTPIDPRDLAPSGSQRLVASWLWNDKLTYPNIKDNVVRT